MQGRKEAVRHVRYAARHKSTAIAIVSPSWTHRSLAVLACRRGDSAGARSPLGDVAARRRSAAPRHAERARVAADLDRQQRHRPGLRGSELGHLSGGRLRAGHQPGRMAARRRRCRSEQRAPRPTGRQPGSDRHRLLLRGRPGLLRDHVFCVRPGGRRRRETSSSLR